MEEGVIKYQLDYTPGQALERSSLAELIAWQRIMHRLGLLGRDPERYGGLAYGNLSQRVLGRGFVISASQTGDRPLPGPDGYCLVTEWDCAANRIRAHGPAKPSSESLTHAALYDAGPAIGCIIHGHSPEIWRLREVLGLASSPDDTPYGTPAMGDAMAQLYQAHGFSGVGAIAMGGHVDGLVSFGRDPDEAGQEMVHLLRSALSLGQPGGIGG